MSTFRVLQFNMQFGQMWDDAYPDRAPIDLNLTIAEIRRHKPSACADTLLAMRARATAQRHTD